MRLMRPPRGFTLIELLVAIAVMALMALLSWRGLDGMTRAQESTRAHADDVLTLQTILAQWNADLNAMQAIDQTQPLAWDGQALRLTRHVARGQQDEGPVVVAWALRAGQWLRWQSPPVHTRAEWQDAWQHAALWARTPGEADRRLQTALIPLQGWQLFYYQGGAWANALSSAVTAGSPRTIGGLSAAAASIPQGVRLQITLAPGAALSGVITSDWISPLNGGGKS